MTKARRKPPAAKTDYDTSLKEAVKDFFFEALEMILPGLAAQADQSRPAEFLEQELRRLVRARFKDAKYCDVLAKIWLKTGEEKWVLLHWEIEVSPRENFGRRMFEYRLLIHLRYQVEDVAAAALYAGPKSKHQVDFYEHCFAGSTITYRFPAYKVWEQDEQALLRSDNPFSIVVLAILYVLKTTGNFDNRLLFKEKLYEVAELKNLSEEKTARLLIFVDNFVVLDKKRTATFQFRQETIRQKSEAMTVTAQNIKTAESIFRGVFGISPKEMKRLAKMEGREEAGKEAEAAVEKADAKARQEAAKAQQEAAKAARFEASLHKSILLLHRSGLAAAEIAAHLELGKKHVEEVIAQAKEKEN